MTCPPGQLAPGLGPLPPVRIHCTQLVETALHSALRPQSPSPPQPSPAPALAPSLMDKFTHPAHPIGKPKIILKSVKVR
jgi:hypothetical protein